MRNEAVPMGNATNPDKSTFMLSNLQQQRSQVEEVAAGT